MRVQHKCQVRVSFILHPVYNFQDGDLAGGRGLFTTWKWGQCVGRKGELGATTVLVLLRLSLPVHFLREPCLLTDVANLRGTRGEGSMTSTWCLSGLGRRVCGQFRTLWVQY